MEEYIRTPDELLARHEELAYDCLIGSAKELHMVDIFNTFAETLYERMTDKTDDDRKKLCTQYYTSEVRGFTLKAGLTYEQVEFDELYMGSRSEISPIMHGSGHSSESKNIIRWMDRNFRKLLLDSGWHVGIIRATKGTNNEKIVVYEERKILDK